MYRSNYANSSVVDFYNYDVYVVKSFDQCRYYAQEIQRQCQKYPVVGFDCEWWTVPGPNRRPVALLQLAAPGGLCVLFRLCYMRKIPQALVDLLGDERILKVGVQSLSDGYKLLQDYGLKVNGTLDLRYMANSLNVPGPYRLAGLAETVLGVQMDTHWSIPASNWETPMLTDSQIDYASKDAIAGMELFRAFNQDIKYK